MEPNVMLASTVVVADPMQLRRAEVLSFLKGWADAAGITPIAVDPRSTTYAIDGGACRMAILNVGGQPLDVPESIAWLEAMRRAAPDAALVVISDREEAGEIVAAFRLGVRGFIPASTEPALALQALTFILNGGQFFPPTALLQGGWRAAPNGHGAARERKAGEASEAEGGLTARQQDVLKLLRLGRPNKVIARELHMCEATVKVHVRQILRRLGASNRTQAALMSSALVGEDAPAASDAAEAATDRIGSGLPIITHANGMPGPALQAHALTRREYHR
jgi:DNA-binding NarL/FixJ family response regulator